ncbi:hypothetical protein Tco_0212979 [Tanacetum coccineum]
MNDMMNPRRPEDRNSQRSEGEKSENRFFEGDEEVAYPFVDNYKYFQEEENNVSFPGVVLGVEEELMPVYDTNIEDVIEEEEGFVGKGGFGGEKDSIEDVVVMANDLYLSIISFRFGLLLGQFACHCTTVVASLPPSCSTIEQVGQEKRKKKKLEKDEHKMVGWGGRDDSKLRFKLLLEMKILLLCSDTMLTKFSSGAYRKRAFNCKSKFVTEREEAGRCNFSVKPLKSKRRGSEKNGRYAAIMLSESRIKVFLQKAKGSSRQQAA